MEIKKSKFVLGLIALIGFCTGTAGNVFAYGGYGSNVNTACAPAVIYSGDCLLCHAPDSRKTPTPAKDAYNAGGTTLTDFFCPSGPICTDNDGDGYSSLGGDCGPVDCNDNDSAIHPGATEVCTDGFDNDCDNLIDVADPDAVGCSTQGIDNDGDGYTITDGDCDDTDANIHPEAFEICTDGRDNNCNGLVDAQDPFAVGCPFACTDYDADNYATEGGDCGQVDCDDSDPAVNPGSEEICSDSIDNDCDGLVDEGCDASCPDLDGDGYPDSSCGGTDCNDNNTSVNPGAEEICGDGVDSNCNGNRDEECQTCPDGKILIIKKLEYDQDEAKLSIEGRANYRTTITIEDADTGRILADGIRVRDGRWKARIRNLDNPDITLRIITEEGCYVYRNLRRDNEEHHGEEEEHHEEEEEHRDEEDD